MRTLLLALLAWPAAAAATTLAVLPLDPGGPPDAWPGLGRALSGMIVSDLVGVDGLTLVERDRLDAVLAELELAGGGFVDPSTAAALGRGLGAEAVLVGSWTVIDGTLGLDARVVDAARGEIVAAAASHGPTAEFVAVEKDVVAALLDGMAVRLAPAARRQLMVQAPTEVFDALAAYGAGLQLDAEGRVAEARAAYARAVAADPSFDAARAALSALSAAVEASAAADADAVDAAVDAARARAWEATAGASPAARRLREQDVGEALIRLHLLWLDGRHCERAAELRAWLDRAGWDPGTLPSGWHAAAAVAFDAGLDTPRLPGQDYLERGDLSAAAGLFADPERALLHYDASEPGHARSQSLLASTLRCLPIDAAIAELRTWEAEARRRGVATHASDREYATWTLAHRLATTRAELQATHDGVDEALAAELEALLADPSLDEGGRATARMRVDAITRAGRAHALRQVRRQGLADDVIVGLAAAVREADPARVDPAVPGCELALRVAAGRMPAWLDALPAAAETPWTPARDALLADISLALAVPLDLGCVRGVPARFPDLTSLIAHVEGAPSRLVDRADAACARAVDALPSRVARARDGYEPEGNGRRDLADFYRGELYGPGCVGVEPR